MTFKALDVPGPLWVFFGSWSSFKIGIGPDIWLETSSLFLTIIEIPHVDLLYVPEHKTLWLQLTFNFSNTAMDVITLLAEEWWAGRRRVVPLPRTCRSLQSSYRDFLWDESTLLGQRQRRKEPTFHTYPTATVNSSFSRLSPLHGDLCRQTLPYCQKKQNPERAIVKPCQRPWATPCPWAKHAPRTGGQVLSSTTFSAARIPVQSVSHRKGHVSASGCKTAPPLRANTPSGTARLAQPAQETHPLPYVGPHKRAKSRRRSPFLPDGTR